MEKLAWLVPALTLAAWAVILLAGRRMPGKGAEVGIFAVGTGWILSFGILGRVILGGEPDPELRAALVGIRVCDGTAEGDHGS